VSADVILIVEDNEQNMELASFLLEEAGYEVRRAMSPEEARQQLDESRPAIVLMDMNLGGADGLTLVAEIRRRPDGQMPIVALTAHAMRGDRERFLAGGCDGYISKPISTRTFVSDVRRHLPGQASAS
jgi:two-component system cell cycle response regulator DivK